jgi:cell division protease FtsH
VPFLFKSGSEFEGMFVGLGASRVRELFEDAKKFPQGCIVFIDEIDSIGGKRYNNIRNYSELTLNQLLSELDGFLPRDKVFIIAATNAPEVLDEALVRAGRFDRKIHIFHPNLRARREIIKIYSKNISLDSSINLEEIAVMTENLSGAQISSLFNEAVVLGFRKNSEKIDRDILFEALDRVLFGPSNSNDLRCENYMKKVAYHEAGHAITALSHSDKCIVKMTINSRSQTGGYT